MHYLSQHFVVATSKSGSLMFQCFKDKSSVMLLKGYVFNDTVKAMQCQDCRSISEVLVTNFNNPNLLLYGCKDSKCKHKILRLSFDGAPENLLASRPVEN